MPKANYGFKGSGLSLSDAIAAGATISSQEYNYTTQLSAITPLLPPRAPSNLTASGAFVFSWVASSDSVDNYVLQYSTDDGVTWITAATTTATSATVTGLDNTIRYFWQVYATKNTAASDPATTTYPVIPNPPTALSLTPGNGQITASWSAPSVTGGSPITGYSLSYTLPDSSTVTVSASSPYTITGLTSGTASTVTVYAVNAIGTSATGTSASATPAALPGNPTGLSATAGDAQIALTWTAPANNGSAITGYTVQYTPSGGSASTVNTGSASAAYTLTGLTNGTSYTVAVAAINAIGTGGYSSNASSTPVTVPSAPTVLAATSGTNSAVPLTWTAPSSNGGASITDYTIQYSSNSGSSWTTFSHSASSATSATVTGLTNGTAYIFQVAAVNSVGTGAYSTASSSVTPSASAFTAIAVLLTSGTSYTVPTGATSMKAWAVGSGGGYELSAAGGCAYKTWSVTGGASVSYSVGGRPTGTARQGNPSTVTYGGVTITGGAGGKNSFPPDPNVAGTYSGGDGGANGGRAYTGAAYWSGGAVGGSASQASCGRTRATDVSGLFAAVALAGGKTTDDCAANAPAFGSGGTYDKYNDNKGPGYGGGIGNQYQTPVGGAVVLYFT